MERFDEKLRAMAEREAVSTPEGFAGRLQETLDGLPPRTKKRQGLGAAKTALIAAAACALLAGTAFAASSGLRELLAQALGGFAPYAQEQAGEAHVVDGIEFRVRSVLADDFTVRAYVEARDLEGSRLDGDIHIWGLVDIPKKDTGEGITSGTFGGFFLGYDRETETALFVVSNWGQVMADNLTGAELRIFSLTDKETGAELLDGQGGACIPVEVTPVPSLSLGAESRLASGLQAEEVRLSAVGLSVIFRDDAGWNGFTGKNVRARLADGTLVDAPWGEGGQGSYGDYGTETGRKVLIWDFREPVEAEQIEGIYVGEDYFPIQ